MPDAGSHSRRAGRVLERSALVAPLVALFFGGYFWIGLSVDPAQERSLATPLDRAIPFLPASIFLYAWVYSGFLFPLFVVRCSRLFRRVAAAYLLVIVVSLLCFALFPVTAAGLRPDLDATRATSFALWGVKLAYALDPPANLFPSVHLAIITLAACSAGRARRAYGALAAAIVVLVFAAVCTAKQHFIVDAVAGVALGAGTYALLVRPHRERPGEPQAYGWGGPLLYLALHSLVYLGCYARGTKTWHSVSCSSVQRQKPS
jgi:membrane-associated phospholipid phosphatase